MLAPRGLPRRNLPSHRPLRFTKSHRAWDKARSVCGDPCGAGPNALGPADFTYGL